MRTKNERALSRVGWTLAITLAGFWYLLAEQAGIWPDVTRVLSALLSVIWR